MPGTLAWQRRSLDDSCQSGKMAELLNSLLFVFNISFLPKYRVKVGPLEDNAGNIITQGFLMAEELNMHFSSVSTREGTCSIPVPETKFNGSEGKGWDS